MIYSPQDLLGTTESLLKYDEDERLSEASPQHLHNALGRAVMIAVGDNWAKSRARRAGKRKAYYLSAEYLVGRLVYNNLFNLGILDEMRRVFAERGIDLACLEEIEDAALGNGGLGRLAACYMDSAATCGVPLSGYGLRYRFGLFKQSFENGAQKESADDWEKHGDPWSFRREKHTVRVRFADQTVLAVPYDTPVIGYHTDNVATLRLWQCEAEQELDFDAFNSQDYERALTEITAQLDAVRSGDFTDEELRCAIRSAAGDLRARADAPDTLAWYWLNRTVQGLDIDPAEMAALVEEVTRTDVTDIAAGVVCDCVYLLKGTEGPADDE